jgi:hypothetical protein
MEKNKVLRVISILLVVFGVGICFGVSIFTSEKLDVTIERAGVCNPLKPVKDKEVKISDKEEKKLQKFWEKTDKTKAPSHEEAVDSLVGDYKLFVGEDTILFNLDLGYVSYNGKYVDISDDFIDYLSAITPIDRSLEAIIMESKDILFGKNKSHMQKAVEVFTMRGMAFKVINNTLQVVNNI